MTDNWWNRAACYGQSTELFFPSGKGKKTGTAKKFCKVCPVVLECLEDVLKYEDPSYRSGVFGGLSDKERKLTYGGAVATV